MPKKQFILILLNILVLILTIGLEVFGQFYTLVIYIISAFLLAYQTKNLLDFKNLYFWFVLSYVGLFYIAPIFEFIYPNEVLFGSKSAISLYHFLNISSIHVSNILYFLFYRPSRIINYQIILKSYRFNKALLISGLFVVVGTLLMLKSVGGFSSINLSRVDLKYVTGSKIYAQLIIYFSSVFFTLLGIMLAKKRTNIFYFLMIIVVFLILEFIFMISLRNRTMILLHLLALLMGAIIYKKISFEEVDLAKKEKFKQIKSLPIMLIFSALLLLGIFVRFARGILFEGSGEITLSVKDMLIASVTNGDIGYANMVIKIIDYSFYNDLALHGQSYYRLILAFIPSAIYQHDVKTTDSLIGQKLTGLDVMTIPPGVFGDAYLNFGYYSFIVFMIYGVAIAFIDNSNKTLKSYLLFSLSFTFIYHFVRGSFVNVILSMIIVYIGILMVNYILKPRIYKS